MHMQHYFREKIIVLYGQYVKFKMNSDLNEFTQV